MKTATAVLVLGAALCACSSGHSGTSTGTNAAGSMSTVRQVIDALNAKGVTCTNGTTDTGSSHTLGTRESGSCDLDNDDSKSIFIYTFANAAQRDQYAKLAAAIAGGIYVEGDTWRVDVATQDEATAVQGALGGQIKG